MNTNSKTTEPEIQQLDKDLLLRVDRDHLVLDWNTSCDFHGTEVHRHICERIDKGSAQRWAQTLESEGSCDTAGGGLRLSKSGKEVVITFVRTFLHPSFVTLSPAGQETLEAALHRLSHQNSGLTPPPVTSAI